MRLELLPKHSRLGRTVNRERRAHGRKRGGSWEVTLHQQSLIMHRNRDNLHLNWNLQWIKSEERVPIHKALLFSDTWNGCPFIFFSGTFSENNWGLHFRLITENTAWPNREISAPGSEDLRGFLASVTSSSNDLRQEAQPELEFPLL